MQVVKKLHNQALSKRINLLGKTERQEGDGPS